MSALTVSHRKCLYLCKGGWFWRGGCVDGGGGVEVGAGPHSGCRFIVVVVGGR
jgi:hypothetical protein